VKPAFVISLDFEMFWGVADSRSIANYRRNIEGEWVAIPEILRLFKQYGAKASWATVGMLMCRNYSEWRDSHPSVMPGYLRRELSPYFMDSIVREHPKLFFGRPLVFQILDTPGQEIASHSYSHFYCDEEGATPEQFAADLVSARLIGAEMGITYRSFVFPRNQIPDTFLTELNLAGYQVYRGNPDHWLYRYGHFVAGGPAGRVIRLTDAYFPISGDHGATVSLDRGLVNVPGSLFLRPWSRRLSAFEPVRLMRLKRAMTAAAESGGIFHLWWHPHNFGLNLEENLAMLVSLLKHYIILRDKYDMQSVQMADFSAGGIF
jgi:peptidoglycan/xylan/chitin deacetylase (PgdA/CDA1 family)